MDFTKKNKLDFNKKKVLFILPSLKAGGAERVISYIASKMRTNIFEVKLIVLGFEKDTVYETGNLEVQYLEKERLVHSIIPLFKIVSKERPNVVVSTIGHVNMLMAVFSIFFRKIKFIGREASVMSTMSQFTNLNSKIIFGLTRLLYVRLAIIICQSEDMRHDFIKHYNLNPAKLLVINNPLTHLPAVVENRSVKNELKFITIGRLSEEKGYLRIIEGLSKITNYDFTYTIIGSGPQEKLIKEKIKSLSLDKKVNFISYTSEVLNELSKQDFFLQGSFVEGFPNALLESCSVGTPVIAFEAPGGTKEIVDNGINGFLVKDEFEFSSILNDLEKLKYFNKKEVVASVAYKFDASNIINQYEKILLTV